MDILIFITVITTYADTKNKYHWMDFKGNIGIVEEVINNSFITSLLMRTLTIEKKDIYSIY